MLLTRCCAVALKDARHVTFQLGQAHLQAGMKEEAAISEQGAAAAVRHEMLRIQCVGEEWGQGAGRRTSRLHWVTLQAAVWCCKA